MYRIILKIKSIFHYIFHISLYINKGSKIYGAPKILYEKRIKLGNGVRINDGVFLHAANGISIGNNTTLSYGTAIITESYDTSNRENYIKRVHSGDGIEIGSDVWICANVTVVPGVKIADGVIVGAGSVVTKSLIKKNSLYAGNPAKFIKELSK